MSGTPTAQPETLARLRANAARAGVQLSDDDLARIASGPFMSNVDNFTRLVAGVPPDTLPDFHKDWRDDRPVGDEPAAAAAATPAGNPLDPFAPLHVVADGAGAARESRRWR